MQVAEKERLPRLSLGEEKNMVTQLLLLNITVFILLQFTRVIYMMEGFGPASFDQDILNNTMLPAAPAQLLNKPWTLLLAMFAHINIWDIFSNMIWLFCFGTLMQHISGPPPIVPLYLFGSLTGMVFYITGMNLIPELKPLAPSASIMGAGAGVMALAAGVTTMAPKARVFPLLLKGGIPVWIITLIFLILHGTAIFTAAGSHANILYLTGGAFTGYLFISRFKRGHNWGGGLNRLLFNISHVFHPKAAKQATAVEVEEQKSGFRNNPHPFTRVGSVPEHKLNELLDKISEQGMNALSPEEKETLLRASRERGEEI